MKRNLSRLSRQYQAALQKHLKQGPRASLQRAQSLGRRVMTVGLEILNLARIHEQAMNSLVLPSYSRSTRGVIVRRAETFFAEVIIPLEQTHSRARETKVHLGRMNEALRQRSADPGLSNRLKQEIAQRRSAEDALRKSEQHYGRLLEQSRHMQDQLRLLSRQLLFAHEEERKKISRELHDVIAQALMCINLRLSNLKKEAALDAKGLKRNIARTQQLVIDSMNIVHRFARELRPRALDELGLIPALHTFMKSFKEQTGIHVALSASASVEQVNSDKRTTLYRVAQEALTNVARHAHASRVELRILKLDDAICMKINDDGKGFPVERVLHGKLTNRLGLLGMRERVEMISGNFTIKSVRGKGTTVLAQIPLADSRGVRKVF